MKGVRLSELARCPRACALRGLGTEPAERDDELTFRRFARGRLFEAYVVAQYERRYGKDDIETQREIPWAHGTGHADIYVRSRKELVEIKTSASPESLLASAIQQVKIYLAHDPEAERGGVYVVDPLDLEREDFFPVRLAAGERDEIRALVESVGRALEGGDLPPCSAASPSACAYKGCDFTDVAWEGWEPPAPVSVDDPELITAAVDWFRAREASRDAERRVSALREDESRLLDELLEAGLPEGEAMIADLRFKRSRVAGRVSVRISDARKAGVWTPAMEEQLGDFVSVGRSFERVDARLIEAVAA